MAIPKDARDTIVKEFAQSPQDTGSVELQVALLTENIRQLTDHCKIHPKDFSSRRGLLKMVCRRRKFLQYLSVSDQEKYKFLIDKLGLRR